MLRYYYLSWFSQPAADRPLYQELHSREVRSIVEMGIGQGVRTRRLFEVALKPSHASEPLRYTGIDLFEARGKESLGLSLKQAFAHLKTEHVKIQLVPGDPLMALSRAANSLAATDVLIISADQQGEALTQAWKYIPRMLHEGSQVYVEQPGKKSGETKFQLLPQVEIARLARDAQRTTRRAA
jgi:hypothetical protein